MGIDKQEAEPEGRRELEAGWELSVETTGAASLSYTFHSPAHIKSLYRAHPGPTSFSDLEQRIIMNVVF